MKQEKLAKCSLSSIPRLYLAVLFIPQVPELVHIPTPGCQSDLTGNSSLLAEDTDKKRKSILGAKSSCLRLPYVLSTINILITLVSYFSYLILWPDKIDPNITGDFGYLSSNSRGLSPQKLLSVWSWKFRKAWL